MLRQWLRHILFIFVLCMSISLVIAQEIETTGNANGILVDHPSNWLVMQDPEFDTSLNFISETMAGFINILPLDVINDDNEDVLTALIDDLEDRDAVGNFSDIEAYTLDETIDVVRVTRIRSDDRLFEVLMTAEVNDFSVYLQASFRIGAQQFFLPRFDAMVASVRNESDIFDIASGSLAQVPITQGMVGTVTDPLNIGALNTRFITQDERYTLDYPHTWQVRTDNDGTITFLEQDETTLIATLQISSLGNSTTTTSLIENIVTDIEQDNISTFMLNDLPASRFVAIEENNNIRRVVMAVIRGDLQMVMDVTMRADAVDSIDATLRAILYSVRPNGEPFTLSVLGGAVRSGLLSAEIYGSTSYPQAQAIEESLLDISYVTINGRFTFDYPSAWFNQISQGAIILSTEEEFEEYEPSQGDAQARIFFLEQIMHLDIDDFTPSNLLAYIIENETFEEDWSDIQVFESDGRSAAYADYDFFGSDIVSRTYFLEIDPIEKVFVRLDLVTDESNLAEYEAIALAILTTADFQD